MTHVPAPGDHARAPAFRIALCIALGIFAGSETGVPPAVWFALALILLPALLLALQRYPPALLFPAAAGLLVACGAVRFLVESPDHPLLPQFPFERSVVARGEVASPPVEKGGRLGFTFRADSLSAGGSPGTKSGLLLSVTVQREKNDRGSFPAAYGMHLVLTGTLTGPPPERNPGEFSLRRYDELRGISGELFIEGFSGIVIRDSSGGDWIMKRCVLPLRREILRRSGELVRGTEGEFLKDLLLGERSGIPPDVKESFVNAGVAHVLAVSGYRVLVIAGMIAFAMRLFRIPSLFHPFIAVPAILFYAALAGGHPPVVRAAVTAIVFIIGKSLRRKTDGVNALGLSALLILCHDPRALFDTGFQLSFAAVLAILYFLPPFSRVMRRFVHPAAVSLAVSAGTLPLIASGFGRVSIAGLLANIPVVPATGAAMILGVLSIVSGAIWAPIGYSYAALEEIILRATIRFSAYAGSLPFASIETGRFGLAETVAWYACIGCAIHRRDRRKAARWLVILLAALNGIVMRAPEPAGPAGLLRVSVIDVGQGDAILVEFPRGGAMLIDAGPLTRTRDAGAKTVAPFLARRGIRSIDLFVITHTDADHAGGAPGILRRVGAGRIVESPLATGSGAGAYRDAAARRGIPCSPAGFGDVLPPPDSARIYVLWPPRGEPAARGRGASNNGSVVLKLVYGGVSFIFAADAERDAERGMIRAWGSFLRADVLKVAHHGSDSGTSMEFLDAVRPALAVLSVGAHNRFGHPSPALLLRLAGAGARVRRTDKEGAVILATDGRSVQEVSWRTSFPAH